MYLSPLPPSFSHPLRQILFFFSCFLIHRITIISLLCIVLLALIYILQPSLYLSLFISLCPSLYVCIYFVVTLCILLLSLVIADLIELYPPSRDNGYIQRIPPGSVLSIELDLSSSSPLERTAKLFYNGIQSGLIMKEIPETVAFAVEIVCFFHLHDGCSRLSSFPL